MINIIEISNNSIDLITILVYLKNRHGMPVIIGA